MQCCRFSGHVSDCRYLQSLRWSDMWLQVAYLAFMTDGCLAEFAVSSRHSAVFNLGLLSSALLNQACILELTSLQGISMGTTCLHWAMFSQVKAEQSDGRMRLVFHEARCAKKWL